MNSLKKLTCLAVLSSTTYLLINSCSKERLAYYADTNNLEYANSDSIANSSGAIIQQYAIEENHLVKQHYIFNAASNVTIKAQEGSTFIIEPNSFVDNNGTVYDGDIDFEIQEIYTKGNMILANRPTTAGDSILESGGEIFIDARDENGQTLQLDKDKTICVKVPTQNPANDMLIFKGEESNNSFNWIESTDDVCTLEPTDSMYLIYVNFLGWVNVDRYTGNCSGGGCGGLVCKPYKTNVILYYNCLNAGDSTIVYLIFPDHVSALKAQLYNGITSQFFKAKGIPIGTDIIVFALTYTINYTYYMDAYTTTITENYMDTLKPVPVSETQVLDFLNSL